MGMRVRTSQHARGGRPALACALLALAAFCLAGCGGAQGAATAPVAVPSPVPPTVQGVPGPSDTPAPLESPDLACPQLPVDLPMSPMPAPGSMPAGSTMQQIQQRGYLIAGVDQDSYNFGFRNPTPGATASGDEFVGYDIDVLRAIAHAIFGGSSTDGDIRFVPVSQDFRMGAANEGVVDLVADSITVTCDRALQVGFSADYFNSGQQLLVDRDNTTADVRLNAQNVPVVTGLKGSKVCTVGTTTSIANILALEKQGGFTTVVAGNWSDCLVLLQQGDVQAVTTDATILEGLEAEDPYLRLAGTAFSVEPHAIAVPASHPASAQDGQFLSFVNGVLAGLENPDSGAWCPETMLSGESCWDALYRVWIGQQPGSSGNATPTPTPPPLDGYP